MQSWRALDKHLHHHLLIMSLDYPLDGDRGRFFFFFFFFVLELWSFRLYLVASSCTYFLAHDVFIFVTDCQMWSLLGSKDLESKCFRTSICNVGKP